MARNVIALSCVVVCYWFRRNAKAKQKAPLYIAVSKEQVESSSPSFKLEEMDDRLSLRFEGTWVLASGDTNTLRKEWKRALGAGKNLKKVLFEAKPNLKWDSSLAAFLSSCIVDCKAKGIRFELSSLPSGLVKLFDMTEVIRGEAKVGEVEKDSPGPLGLIGSFVLLGIEAVRNALSFIGKWTLSVLRLFSCRARCRFGDFLESCKACGASALPVVTLVSFLTGLTMAFVGSVQLDKFNARIYVADLVSLAMVREMGGLMVAIVMSGRTCAAFAAELGNMKLNEEIDSLKTFGISPMDFLVLPRTLALFVMTPMLTLYADVVGILGGVFVGTMMMDFSLLHYFEQTQAALNSMWDVYSGLIKSLAFGLIIGMVGCQRGLNCGNDSAALGRAVTSAVVTSITLVVVADASFEVFYSLMDWR